MLRSFHRWPGLLAAALLLVLSISGAALSVFPAMERTTAPADVPGQTVAELATRILVIHPTVEQVRRVVLQQPQLQAVVVDHAVLRDASLGSELRNQIDYVESPEVVSTDFVGSNRAGIVDGLATKAEGIHAVVYVWYDNENGYSHQVVRVAEAMVGAKRPVFPASRL